MKRQVSLEEISDGKLYGRNDMVRACTGGCKGCSACCSGMGNSVILDPLDMYRLTAGLGFTFGELMEGKIELNVVDGVILPNLKMDGENGTCAFLNEAGRCSIHPQRPGVCRLFPLGRYYAPREEGRISQAAQNPDVCRMGQAAQNPDVGRPDRAAQNPDVGRISQATQNSDVSRLDKTTNRAPRGNRGFRYFLQVHECPAPNRTKIRVSKWVDTPDLDRYERFVNDWHYFLEDVQERLEYEDEEGTKQINLLLLRLFYVRPYQSGDFYEQFGERLAVAVEALDL